MSFNQAIVTIWLSVISIGWVYVVLKAIKVPFIVWVYVVLDTRIIPLVKLLLVINLGVSPWVVCSL